MSFGQFAASLLMGLLSVLIPLLVFVVAIAALVYIARRWMDRSNSSR
jgi:uncharacterized membrane protein YhaH (DUF805 family)